MKITLGENPTLFHVIRIKNSNSRKVSGGQSITRNENKAIVWKSSIGGSTRGGREERRRLGDNSPPP